MRSLAEEWGIDELAVIREHKEILRFLSTRLAGGGIKTQTKLKVRRGLRQMAIQLRRDNLEPPFARFVTSAVVLVLALAIYTLRTKIGI